MHVSSVEWNLPARGITEVAVSLELHGADDHEHGNLATRVPMGQGQGPGRPCVTHGVPFTVRVTITNLGQEQGDFTLLAPDSRDLEQAATSPAQGWGSDAAEPTRSFSMVKGDEHEDVPFEVAALDVRTHVGEIAAKETVSVLVRYLPLSIGLCSTAPLELVDKLNERTCVVGARLEVRVSPSQEEV